MLRGAKSMTARVYQVDMRKAGRWLRLASRTQLGVVLVLVAAGFAPTWAEVVLGLGGSLIIWFVGEELSS